MITVKELHQICTKEFATTVKVMQSFPADQLLFRPHERSSSAQQLLSTFVFEMYLLNAHVGDATLETDQFSGYSPNDCTAVITDFEQESAVFLNTLQQLSDDRLSDSISFAGTDFSVAGFIRMMLFDQIHHRGQLSVYIRLAGGLVPSIYGPSADDTSTNL